MLKSTKLLYVLGFLIFGLVGLSLVAETIDNQTLLKEIRTLSA